jgi:hyperosmotically inducible protein
MLKKTVLCTALMFISFDTALAASLNGHSSNTTASVHTAVSDAAITTKIKSLFLRSSVVKHSKISVSTTNHQVTLSGKLNTDQEYERAVTLAKSVDGVTDVNTDGLQVSASQTPIHDTYITAMVKGAFIKEKLFGTKDIEVWPVEVETKDGAVYLTGEVDTAAQRDNAVSIAQQAPGVKTVNSTITVKQ